MAIERFGKHTLAVDAFCTGKEFTDAETDELRDACDPTSWIAYSRSREAAITAAVPRPGDGPSRQLGPMPEASKVRLKTGGPVMTVEDIRDSVKLVQCLWFDDAKHVQRDAFHKDALEVVPAGVDPATDTVAHMWREVAKAKIDDPAAIDMVACELYRAQCEASDNRFQMPAWMNIGEDARNTYRATVRTVWKAIAELTQ